MPEQSSARPEPGVAHDAVQADLRFLFDARAGEHALIIGDWPVLSESLRRRGVNCVEGSSLLSGSDSEAVDLLLVPRATGEDLPGSFDVATQRLRVGGHLVFGFRNACSLQRLRFWKRRRGTGRTQREVARSLATIMKRLDEADFSVLSCHGIRDHVERPRQVVPLDDSRLSRWLFSCSMVPESRAARLALAVAPTLCFLGLQNWLYADILVVARKESEGGHQ